MTRLGGGLWLVALVLLLGAVPVDAAEPAVDTVPWEDGRSRGGDLEIHLVTVGPGDDPFMSAFGHSAIIVADARFDVARFYNYGATDFENRSTALKVAAGYATYWAQVDDPAGALKGYRDEGRDVRLMKLDLAPALRLELAERLADDVKEENRYYRYHWFHDNCTTRIRDVLDDVLGGALRNATMHDTGMTVRDHAWYYFAPHTGVGYTASFILNGDVDRLLTAWETMFIPLGLEAVLRNFTYEDANGTAVSLNAGEHTYHDAGVTRLPDERAVLWPGALGVGLAAGAAAVVLGGVARTRRWARRGLGGLGVAAGLVLGSAGLLLSLAWGYGGVNHHWPNQNLLLANAVTLAAVPLAVAWMTGRPGAGPWLTRLWGLHAVTAAVALLLKGTPWPHQDNWMHVAMVLPLVLGLTAGTAWATRAEATMEDVASPSLDGEEVADGSS